MPANGVCLMTDTFYRYRADVKIQVPGPYSVRVSHVFSGPLRDTVYLMLEDTVVVRR